jgi:exopolysaccharide production protein ExoZ
VTGPNQIAPFPFPGSSEWDEGGTKVTLEGPPREAARTSKSSTVRPKDDVPATKKLSNVQALRGLAALGVVLFHIATVESRLPGTPTTLAHLFGNGWAGVDLFFVLSGFVMVTVTRGKFGSSGNSRKFLYDRMFRIFPLYWCISLVILGMFLVKPTLFHSIGHPSLLRSFLLVPQFNQAPLLGQGWTLIFEMYFYYIFAALIPLAESFLSYGLISWLILIIAVNLSLHGQSHSALASLVGNPLSVEFIIGCFVAKLIYSGVTRYAGSIAMVSAGLIVAISLAIGAHLDDHVSSWLRLLLFGVPFGFLTYGLVALEVRDRLLLPSLLSKIGDTSYSLYLVHMLPIGLIAQLSHRLPRGLSGLSAPAMLSAALLAGYVCYRGLEQPFMRVAKCQKRKLFQESTSRAPRLKAA